MQRHGSGISLISYIRLGNGRYTMNTSSSKACITCKNIAENPNPTPAEARVLSCCEAMHNAKEEFKKFLGIS